MIAIELLLCLHRRAVYVARLVLRFQPEKKLCSYWVTLSEHYSEGKRSTIDRVSNLTENSLAAVVSLWK